ncbi:hypothetical protein [Brevundimonas nasdae]|uniref:hypothetical protein n=1 Tax=Brevundimonas nasdae TaxID=172043 RepID=UPI0030167D26
MSDTPKRTGYDHASLLATLQALTGEAPSIARSTEPVDALTVVDRALDAVSRDPGPWCSDGPFSRKIVKIENGWISCQKPGSGGTFGPDFQILIRVDGEDVLSVKWYEGSGEEKKVFRLQPGSWMSEI